jgi:hypothetical protein
MAVEAGITSISVQGTTTNVNLGNGNTQIAEGSFTRSNGTVGKSAVAELSGSLLLASNGFYRAFTDDPTLTSAAKTPPQMQGSSWARDLREARICLRSARTRIPSRTTCAKSRFRAKQATPRDIY